MTVIYARTNLPHVHGRGLRTFKNIIRVTSRYINDPYGGGVVRTRNLPIMKYYKPTPPTPDPDLEVSTNSMLFEAPGGTEQLGIKTSKSWEIV